MPLRSHATLADWLSYQERLHPNPIDLGLDRLRRVLERLQWPGFRCPVITVGGTNGKGSTVALLSSILSEAGYRVGSFTSPHLIRYNERIRIAGEEIDDQSLIDAFERIEHARGEVSLTFFEFNTLAALLIFEAAQLDAVVLEVGLGGLLDAVNVVDADVAIVCSIALDHCEWLGHDVESIARWKAGIFRAQRPALFGSREMPHAIASEARKIGAHLLRLGVDFDFELLDVGDESRPARAVTAQAEVHSLWCWRGIHQELRDLPLPALSGEKQLDNAATALTALDCLRDRLPLTRDAIERGLMRISLAGRFQVRRDESGIEWILDVAHNPAAAETLADNLRRHPAHGRTIAVCGMFADKDVTGVISALSGIDMWVVAGLTGPRALAPAQLAEKIATCGGRVEHVANSVSEACSHARALAREGDRIVVFGSFHTVGPALEWLQN